MSAKVFQLLGCCGPRCQGWLWWSGGCVCECKCYQISIYHHTSSKTLLMPSPQCILTIPGYKTNSNSGGNSRYIPRPDLTNHPGSVTVESSVFSMQWLLHGIQGWINSSSFNGRWSWRKGKTLVLYCDLCDYVCSENILVLGPTVDPGC